MVEQNAPRDTPIAKHHTELFREPPFDMPSDWGFQCFNCGLEQVGWATLTLAEAAADQHVASQGAV